MICGKLWHNYLVTYPGHILQIWTMEFVKVNNYESISLMAIVSLFAYHEHEIVFCCKLHIFSFFHLTPTPLTQIFQQSLYLLTSCKLLCAIVHVPVDLLHSLLSISAKAANHNDVQPNAWLKTS